MSGGCRFVFRKMGLADIRPCFEDQLAACGVTYFDFYLMHAQGHTNKVQEIFRSKHLIPCTSCRYCTVGCPKHISIPDLFAIMNTRQLYHDWNADYYYGAVRTAPGRKASDCLECGKCETVCPQHLPIRQLLKDAAKEFEQK